MVRKFVILSFLLALFVCISCTDKIEDNYTQSNVTNVQHLNILAEHYEKKEILDSAFYYHNAAKVEYLKNYNNFDAALELLTMAEIQLKAGDYFGVENTINDALPLLNDSGHEIYFVRAYTTLAATYSKMLNYDNALHYYTKAYTIAKDSLSRTNIMHHIAGIHIEKGNYNDAITILTSLEKSIISSNPVTMAYIKGRLGYALFKQNKTQGLKYMLQALAARKRTKDLEGIFLSYIHLSEYYSLKDPETAKEYALWARNTAVKLGNTDLTLQAIAFLINNSSGNELKKYSNEYFSLENSSKRMHLDTKNKFVRIKYSARKNEIEKAKLSEETDRALLLQISSDHNKLLLLSLIFTIFCSAILYFLVKSKHKRERFMEAYITETRIAKKVHDEIANEIYGTINYLTSDNALPGKSKEKLISQLDNIYLMTKNISREANNIDTGAMYPEYLKLMLTSYTTPNVNVIIKGISDINWENIDDTKKIATYRSLQELMVNMRKHSNATLVLLDFILEGKKMEIRYSDNGRGVEDDKLLLKNGLLNIENRMVSIDGSIIFDTSPGKGFRLKLTYPAYTPYVQKNFNHRRH